MNGLGSSQAMSGDEPAVIVEGYTDALMAHQAGFTDVVASLVMPVMAGMAAAADTMIYAFYGANDGLLRAVKAGFASDETGVSPGDERWGRRQRRPRRQP